MRDYGTVSPKFWTGETGKALRQDPGAQVLALYLMTSPHSNMLGVYYCPVMYMAHETGLGMEGASKALARLIDAGFCMFDEASETVFVRRMAAHQIGEALSENDKRVLGIQKEVAKMGDSPLKTAFVEAYAQAFHLTPQKGKKAKPLASPLQAPTKPGTGTGTGTGTGEGSSEPDGSEPEVSGFAVPLNDGSEWNVPLATLEDWVKTFPAVDVEQELREMRAWANANPTKRKTGRGVAAFAVRWLSKAQDTPSRTVTNGASRHSEVFV